MTPIERYIEQLTLLTLERHGWLESASRQVRQWREEDESEGIFWNTQGRPATAQEAAGGNCGD